MVQPPLNGVNGHYVNTDNSNLAYFGSTNNSRSFGLSGAVDNNLAANASRIKGGCWWWSNKRNKKKKISKKRKNKNRSKKYRGGKNNFYNPYANIQKGGLQSVTNFNNGYSTGGILSSNELGLANPVPYHQNNYVANPYYPNTRLSY